MNKLFLSRIILAVAIPLFALTLWNCEKDDICDPLTDTTPRLVIGLYDINENDEPLAANVAVVAENIPDADTIRFVGKSQIELPIDITQDQVRYKLIRNEGNPNPMLVYTDIVEFNYSRTTTYVSRACGFKNTFTLNNDSSLPPAFILNDNPLVVPGAWIKNISVENYSIVNEANQHVQIFL